MPHGKSGMSRDIRPLPGTATNDSCSVSTGSFREPGSRLGWLTQAANLSIRSNPRVSTALRLVADGGLAALGPHSLRMFRECLLDRCSRGVIVPGWIAGF
jgi:hypothetical protein